MDGFVLCRPQMRKAEMLSHFEPADQKMDEHLHFGEKNFLLKCTTYNNMAPLSPLFHEMFGSTKISCNLAGTIAAAGHPVALPCRQLGWMVAIQLQKQTI